MITAMQFSPDCTSPSLKDFYSNGDAVGSEEFLNPKRRIAALQVKKRRRYENTCVLVYEAKGQGPRMPGEPVDVVNKV